MGSHSNTEKKPGVDEVKEFLASLRQEQQLIQERRIKLSVQKIAFTLTFLGIGASGLSFSSGNVQPALYLAPLIAVLFDLQGCSSTIALYRVNAFLRLRNKDQAEEEWQKFLKDNRVNFAWWVAVGFTGIVFLASIFTVFGDPWMTSLTGNPIVKGLWFFVIAILWGIGRWREWGLKTDLRKMEKMETRIRGWLQQLTEDRKAMCKTLCGK